jgi:thymidylate kinase
VREAYLFLARENGWPVISDERPPEEVSRELQKVLSARLSLPGC